MRTIILCLFWIKLLTVDALAQLNDSLIAEKFDNYNKIWHKNKILLVTNQEKFITSDTIYLKCYLLNEDLSLEEENQMVTVSLVDSKGKSSCQIAFVVKNGVGENQMILPKALAPGIYLLTAYTNWMRNFNNNYFFRKEITIVKNKKVVPIVQKTVRFAIEGGRLVNEESNKIVFSGYKSGSVVQIIDSLGNEIVANTADMNGMGAVYFVPKDGMAYKIGSRDEKNHISLPRAESNAVGLRIIRNIKDDSIRVSIVLGKEVALPSSRFFLVLSGRSKILSARSHTFNKRKSFQEVISVSSLPEGVYSISLLDANGNLIAQRDFHSVNADQLNKKVTLSKDRFLTNDSISVHVFLKDEDGNPLKADFSINVLNRNVLDTERTDFIKEELIIYNGRERDRSLNDRSNWLETIDNYLIMNPEFIPWNHILKSKPSNPRYLKTNIVQRTGVAYFSDGKKMLDSADIFFYGQKSRVKYQTKVLHGKVWVPLPTLYGQDELFYVAEDFYYQNGVMRGLQLPTLRIKWDLDSIDLPRPVLSRESDLVDDFGLFKERVNSLYRSFGSQSTMPSFRPLVENDFEREINGADVIVNVEDFVVFPTMAELIKEAVPSLFHRVEKGREIVRVILAEKMAAVSSGDPVYLIDGIATSNTNFFLSIKPIDLIQIKIVKSEKKLRPFGLMGKNGIVIVQTKQENRREPIDVSDLVEGLNSKTVFPSLKKNVSEIPKFRSTIYWQPNVRTDENGKASAAFNLSDDIGAVEITIQGIALNGMPFSINYPIKVGLAKRAN